MNSDPTRDHRVTSKPWQKRTLSIAELDFDPGEISETGWELVLVRS